MGLACCSKKMHKAVLEITDDYGRVERRHLRSELAKFATEMEATLQENDHKSGWDEMSMHQLFHRIKGEFEELQQEYILQSNSREGVNKKDRLRKDRLRKEAIDIANFCMFLAYWTHKDD